MTVNQTAGDRRLKTVPAKCGTCEALQQAPLVCADCHTLLAHVEGADYFELFCLPRGFDLDAAELDRKYLAVSRNIHPDRFATAGPEMQSFALRASAAVNRAHDVLRHPLLRAEYLLETAGGKSSADDKRVPESMLGEVMMIREEIEEAKTSADSATLAALKTQLADRRHAAERRIADLCRALTDGATDATRDDLRMQLNGMKYLDNLLAQF